MDEQQQPSEEELRAAFEAELAKVHVADVIAQTIVSLINIGARRGGLTGGGEEEHDLTQLALSIEATRRLLPLIEDALGPGGAEIKEALSQLQLAFAQQAPTGAQVPTGDPAGDAPKKDDRPNSGLWVPGQ